MVMENWLWIIAIPLIHLYQNVIGPENAFNWDFEPDVEPFHFKAGVEQTFNDALTFDDFTTETLELPHTDVDERPLTSEPAALGIPGPAKTSLWDPHRSQFELPHFTDDQSPLPTLPAALGPLGPTQPVFGDRYGVQNDFPAQSTTSHSPRNILFGSASLKRIPEAYLEAAASKRLKTQEPLAHHPPSSLNYIPPSHEFPINAYSQPSEGPSIASTDTNYRMEQIGDGSGLHHSALFPTDGQHATDHVPWPFLNHQVGSFQTDTHQQNNLKRNRNNLLDISRLETLELRKDSHEASDQDSQNQEPIERVKFLSHEPIPTMRFTSTALLIHLKDNPSRPIRDFEYCWVNFQTSTIHEQLVLQLIDDFRFTDGTSFSKLLPDLSHAQEPSDIIQNQFPKKMLCLKSSSLNISDSFNFFLSKTRSGLQRPGTKQRQELVRTANIIFKKNNKNYVKKNADLALNYAHEKKIEAYQETVLRKFQESIDECWEAVKKVDINEIISKKRTLFEKSIKHFPIYLLYVDLINALMPVHGLMIKDELLNSERKLAAKRFFELIQELVLSDKQGDWKNNPSDRRSTLMMKTTTLYSSREFGSQNRFTSFIWKAIEYWIITSRRDLQRIDNIDGGPFKEFLNKLVFSLVDTNEMAQRSGET